MYRDSSNNNTDNGNYSAQEFKIQDPARYYQMMYAKMPTKFDDGRFAGYNHFSFPGFGEIKSIGQIPLQKTIDYPTGMN